MHSSTNYLMLFSFVALTLLNLRSYSQSKTDSVWIETAEGCKVYNPHPIKNESIIWTGKCLNGYASGEGVLTWLQKGKRNEVYTGRMERGMPEGYGRYDYLNGSIYEGEYAKGDLVKGCIVRMDKDSTMLYSYDGELKNDEADGYGTEVQYTFYYGDTSSVYTGFFRQGISHGRGLYTEYGRNEKTIYKGNFFDGTLEGEAELWNLEGGREIRYYKGNFKSGKCDGYGKERIGQNEYEGQWKDGEKGGQGKLVSVTELVYEGSWKDGKMDGEGRRIFPDGSYYIGSFKKNEPDGFGVMCWTNGVRYVGEFRAGLFHGYGFMYRDTTYPGAGIWANGLLTTSESYPITIEKLKTKYKENYAKFTGLTEQ